MRPNGRRRAGSIRPSRAGRSRPAGDKTLAIGGAPAGGGPAHDRECVSKPAASISRRASSTGEYRYTAANFCPVFTTTNSRDNGKTPTLVRAEPCVPSGTIPAPYAVRQKRQRNSRDTERMRGRTDGRTGGRQRGKLWGQRWRAPVVCICTGWLMAGIGGMTLALGRTIRYRSEWNSWTSLGTRWESSYKPSPVPYAAVGHTAVHHYVTGEPRIIT